MQMNVDATALKSELGPSERLLWAGQPKQGFVFRASELFLTPFALLWCGFAISWEWRVFQAPNTPVFFVLGGIPFVVIGLYLVFGRFLVESAQRTKTFYGVTNERVLIVSGLFRRNVKSLNLCNLSGLSLSESSNGEGAISFGGGSPFSSVFGGFSGWPGMDAYLGPRFDLVQNAKAVYETIRGAQRASV